METGSSSDSLGPNQSTRHRFKQPEATTRGQEASPSTIPQIEPFVPRRDHNPRELKSWAKRTGFVSTFSGETSSSNYEKGSDLDLERGPPTSTNDRKLEIDLVLGRAGPSGVEIEPGSGSQRGNENGKRRRLEDEFVLRVNSNNNNNESDKRFNTSKKREEERREVANGGVFGNVGGNGNRNGVGEVAAGEKKEVGDEGGYVGVDLDPGRGVDEPLDGEWHRQNGFKYGLRDNLGLVRLIYYGLQHYLSMAGSLIFIPLIIVPAMDGTDEDTATVISTVLFVSGITTLLHSFFGTRLPLVQGSSFVYLAPALVIMNSQEHRNLTVHKFRHIMRELQGAIIVGSVFQSFLGFTGLMSLFLRLINPVVVGPTVTAVGFAFFSYGFPQAGSCVEISIPLILLVLIFTLYLRGISVFGHRFFRIYAVPLSVMIVWIYAVFLTAGGAYNYRGCNPNIPSSNILIDACRKHAYTMQHCRTDASNAWRTAAWVRIPYPFQWGFPIFHFRTSLIMIFASLVATVDSVGTYHSASFLVTSKRPTPGIVSRGIALEGFCSILAGLWGTGTGSTTLTENVHTINVTKVASRRVVEVGAIFLILFSFFGKVGAILASIPKALAAAILCFIWGLIVALGLSTLQYSQTASFRNIVIVGVSLFLGLSIPTYFQQYQPLTSLVLPSYLLPYAAASDGPIQTSSKDFNFAMNALLSLNMVVTFLVAFVLDNTVPGSRQERGLYIWSHAEDMATDPYLHEDYALPRKVGCLFSWSRCLRA